MFTQLVVSAILLGVASGEVARFQNCDGVSNDVCTISEVRITPCDSSKKVCALKNGESANIAFDFTPNFSADSMILSLRAVVVGTDMDVTAWLPSNDACQFSTCPVEKETLNTLKLSLKIGKKVPKGTFPLTWKLFNPNDEGQLCCFKNSIKVH